MAKRIIEIVEPPAAMIMWDEFASAIKSNWDKPADLHRFLGGGKSSAYRVWDGEPIGVLAFLRICKKMNQSPLHFFAER